MDSYAIVETGGMQFRMEPGEHVRIPKIDKKQGSKLRFDRVLLVSDEKGIEVGKPVVKNVTVSAKIVEHGRGPKIVVYKRKRRKGYEKRTGHRQDYTEVLIQSLDRKPKKTAAKKKADSAEKPASTPKKKTTSSKKSGTAKKKTEDG